MKRILFTIAMLWSIAYGQSKGYLRYDSVIMEKVGGNTSLTIRNSTRNVTGGVLTNMGAGVTQFVLPQGNEIDVFLIGGQSNMRGVGDSATSPNPQPGTVYQYDAGVFDQVTNEVGHLPSGRGSLWPTFGINWHRLTARKICFIQRAVDGSGQMVLSDVGFGNWGPSGTLFQMSLDTLNAALSAITAAGYQPVFRGVVWGQGENDARKINSATITKLQYKDTLTSMIARYRNALGSDLPFYVYQTGTETVTSDVGYDSVRQAQAEVVAANPLRNKMISTNAFDFAARSLLNLDGLHWSQTALNEQGTVGPVNIVDGLDLQWQRSGTSLSYILGRVGVGIKLPAFPFHVATTTGDVAKFAGNGNGLMSLWMENTNGGSSAGDAIRFSNNLGFGAQIAYGSSTNAFTPNGLLMHPFTGDYWMGANAGNIYFFTGATGPLLANIKSVITQNGALGIGSTPVASAILDVGSTTKGALLPRMTSTQRTSISSPAIGLIVFDTDSSAYFFYNSSIWVKMSAGSTTDTNIYNTDGTLTANRTLTGASKDLTMTGLGTWSVDATGMLLNSGSDLVLQFDSLYFNALPKNNDTTGWKVMKYHPGTNSVAWGNYTGGGGTTYTFSTGLNESAGTVTNKLSTGVSGGQSVIGGTAANDLLTINGNNSASSNTAANPNIKFGVGNSGSTVAGQIHNNGIWAMGSVANSDANTFRLVIQQLDNTANDGIIIYPNANTATNMMIGYGNIICNSSDFRISATGGAIKLNSSSGIYIGGVGTPNSTAQVAGSLSTAYASTATSLTIGIGHQVLAVTATGQTITLPTAVGITGRAYTIKLTASGSCTVATTSSQNIDASTTYSLSAQYKYVTVVSDGANWIITANN